MSTMPVGHCSVVSVVRNLKADRARLALLRDKYLPRSQLRLSNDAIALSISYLPLDQLVLTLPLVNRQFRQMCCRRPFVIQSILRRYKFPLRKDVNIRQIIITFNRCLQPMLTSGMRGYYPCQDLQCHSNPLKRFIKWHEKFSSIPYFLMNEKMFRPESLDVCKLVHSVFSSLLDHRLLSVDCPMSVAAALVESLPKFYANRSPLYKEVLKHLDVLKNSKDALTIRHYMTLLQGALSNGLSLLIQHHGDDDALLSAFLTMMATEHNIAPSADTLSVLCKSAILRIPKFLQKMFTAAEVVPSQEDLYCAMVSRSGNLDLMKEIVSWLLSTYTNARGKLDLNFFLGWCTNERLVGKDYEELVSKHCVPIDNLNQDLLDYCRKNGNTLSKFALRLAMEERYNRPTREIESQEGPVFQLLALYGTTRVALGPDFFKSCFKKSGCGAENYFRSLCFHVRMDEDCIKFIIEKRGEHNFDSQDIFYAIQHSTYQGWTMNILRMFIFDYAPFTEMMMAGLGGIGKPAQDLAHFYFHAYETPIPKLTEWFKDLGGWTKENTAELEV